MDTFDHDILLGQVDVLIQQAEMHVRRLKEYRSTLEGMRCTTKNQVHPSPAIHSDLDTIPISELLKERKVAGKSVFERVSLHLVGDLTHLSLEEIGRIYGVGSGVLHWLDTELRTRYHLSLPITWEDVDNRRLGEVLQDCPALLVYLRRRGICRLLDLEGVIPQRYIDEVYSEPRNVPRCLQDKIRWPAGLRVE